MTVQAQEFIPPLKLSRFVRRYTLEQFLEKYGNNESLYKGSDPIIIRRKI